MTGLATSYEGQGPHAGPLALIGSHGNIEIAATNANTSAALGLGVGDTVTVRLAFSH